MNCIQALHSLGSFQHKTQLIHPGLSKEAMGSQLSFWESCPGWLAQQEERPKAGEAVENALFYQIWNWSLQVRVRQMCRANRKVWAAHAYLWQPKVDLLPNASFPFLSHRLIHAFQSCRVSQKLLHSPLNCVKRLNASSLSSCIQHTANGHNWVT